MRPSAGRVKSEAAIVAAFESRPENSHSDGCRSLAARSCREPREGIGIPSELRFLRVVSYEADRECEDHAADRAAADVPNPPLDRCPRDSADELADNAAADNNYTGGEGLRHCRRGRCFSVVTNSSKIASTALR